MGDDRAIVYEENGKTIYRASALGFCTKELAAIRSGVEAEATPDWLMERFAQGNEGEPVIISLLQNERGVAVVKAQLEVEVEVGESAVIRGHIDGMVGPQFDDERKTLIEAKALSASSMKRWKADGFAAFPYYAVQVSVYMYATGCKRLWMVFGLKDDEGIVQGIEVYEFDQAPMGIGKIKAKVAGIEKLASSGELPEDCDYRHYPCSVSFLHDDQGEVSALIEDAEFDQWVDEYYDANAREKIEKDRKKVAAERIAKLFDSHGAKGGQLTTGLWEVTDVIRIGKSLNKERAKADGVDLDKYYEPTTQSRYPTIKPTAQGKVAAKLAKKKGPTKVSVK